LKKEIQISRENNLKNINEISAVASIGGGPIGAGWTAHFLAKGLNVKCYLHSEDEIDDYKSLIETAWQTLKKLGINENASIKNMQIYTDLKESLTDVDFVQESIPEILEIKQDFYSQIDLFLKPDVIIASSTSGLLISEIVKNCDTRDRAIVGHPFNPPYLLPLVEVVASEYTDKALVDQAVNFYRAFDKVPIVLKKEIPGFIATRLQEALWREALHMVANEEATPEQIDLALINGPAPRMAYQGQCMAFHVACGEGGMATNLDQFGPALKLPWTRLKAPDLTQDLRDKMVNGCAEMSKGKHFLEMAKDRDNAIAAILSAIKNNHPNN
tara:strand:+ start:1011 stop:1994 length:984 start_codon:yes stop_codon:yes gene_type:complete